MISKINDFEMPFLLRVARGQVPGMKTYVIAGSKDGISSSVLDDLTQIPGTTVAPIPGGIQLEVVSNSGNDTSTGTGARTVELHYLDGSGLEQSEIIIMNGAAAVATSATDIENVQWLHVKTKGSLDTSAGNISLQGVGAGTVYEYIAAGGNQSLSARYTVPSDKKGYLFGWRSSAIVRQVDFRIRATAEREDRALIPGVFLFQDTAKLIDAPSGFIDLPWLEIPPLGCIKISGISKAAGGNGGGSFQILLVDN
jgi:hypothetical protein